MIELVDYCSNAQLREMFKRFYPNDGEDRAEVFADKINEMKA